MRGLGIEDRPATSDEADAFIARLKKLLDRTRQRLAMAASGEYEMRVMTIRSHSVMSHTRKAFKKVYLAKRVTRKRKPRINPVATAIHKSRGRTVARKELTLPPS